MPGKRKSTVVPVDARMMQSRHATAVVAAEVAVDFTSSEGGNSSDFVDSVAPYARPTDHGRPRPQNPAADPGKMPAAMHHFTDIQLRRVVRTLLERAGSEPAEAALRLPTILVEANLRGHDSHGIGMIPHYVHNITNGTASPEHRAVDS